MKDVELVIQEGIKNLTEKELEAYNYFVNLNESVPVPEEQAKLFVLFLSGKSCQEIQESNQQFSLGQVIYCRLLGEWDNRYNAYLTELLNNTMKRLQTVTLETIGFLCDLISVANAEHGEKIRNYIKTKNPEDLGGLQITTLNGYKNAIELLQKITGQDGQKKKEITINHTNNSSGFNARSGVSSDDASKILEMLVESNVQEKETK